mgnify:CR=1 FL=1
MTPLADGSVLEGWLSASGGQTPTWTFRAEINGAERTLLTRQASQVSGLHLIGLPDDSDDGGAASSPPRVMLVWAEGPDDGEDVYAAVVGADGAPITLPLRLHASAAGSQSDVQAAMLEDGRVLVSWSDSARLGAMPTWGISKPFGGMP